MKNPNLVPKSITDKNGVTAVRWVKPDQTTATSLSSIPAPAPVVTEIQTHADPAVVMDAALAYTKRVTYDEDDEEYIEECLTTTVDGFSTYPAAVVDDILQESSNSYERMLGLKDLMDARFSTDVPEGYYLGLRDYLNLFNYADDAGANDGGQVTVMIGRVTSSYDGLEPVSLTGNYPERRKKQLEGLIGGTMQIRHLISEGKAGKSLLTDSQEHDVAVITDKRLADLFINRPEDHEMVLSFMDERKTADYDRIMELLDSKTPAIASGAL